MPRDEFTPRQKRQTLEANAAEVRRRFPDLASFPQPFYQCDECGFISDQRGFFQVDHIWACANGGTSNRHVASASLLQRMQAGELEAYLIHGVNAQVLCVGCNQAKKARQFVPPGSGYAYRYPEWDRNPDHIYSGPPEP